MCDSIHGLELSRNKVNSYLKIAGNINEVFRPQKALQETRFTLYDIIHWHLQVLYDSENWYIKARDARRITAAEVKYIRQTAG